jgi:hypothetical protein
MGPILVKAHVQCFGNALQTAEENICPVKCPLITVKKLEQVFMRH